MIRRLVKTIGTSFAWAVEGVSGKTSWEWLELLIVPLFLACGAFYIEARTKSRQERIAEEKTDQIVLDKYLEKMQGLLLDRGLRESSENSEVRSVARVMTATTIKELDSKRNSFIVDFLRESNLIGVETDTNEKEQAKDIPFLSELNLSDAELRGADLRGVSLRDVDLRGADLRDASLRDADLENADLRGADLRDVSLIGANFRGVELDDADLRGANLNRTQSEDSLLCNTQLPKRFRLDSDRDCEF